MPYKISFLFEQGEQGWTENWYTTNSNNVQTVAQAFAASGFVGPYTAMKGNECSIQGVRVSDTTNPRNNYLISLNQKCSALGGAQYGVSTMSGASMLCDLQTTNFYRR